MKKGFTLVELLAVVVLLAIVSLIATPIISNVIEASKESANQRSIEGYANAVRNEYYNQQTGGGIPVIDDAFLSKVDTQGNQINCENVLYSTDYQTILNKCTIADELDKLYCYADGKHFNCEDSEFLSILQESGNLVDLQYELGDLLKVDVGSGIIQNIYVVATNEEKITGILESNLKNNIAWISKEDYNTTTNSNFDTDYNYNAEQLNQNLFTYGPVTANKTLQELTADWNNVENIKIPSFEEMLKLTEFYKNLTDKTNLEALYFTRAIEALENVGGCSSSTECRELLTNAGYGDLLLPEWAISNLDGSTNTVAYWLNNPISYEIMLMPDNAYTIQFGGVISDSIICFGDNVNASKKIGLRPLLTIDVSNVIEKIEY